MANVDAHAPVNRLSHCRMHIAGVRRNEPARVAREGVRQHVTFLHQTHGLADDRVGIGFAFALGRPHLTKMDVDGKAGIAGYILG